MCHHSDIFFHKSGQPVAWCISDKENTDVIEVFLRSVKDRSPETVINVIMTDDGMILQLKFLLLCLPKYRILDGMPPILCLEMFINFSATGMLTGTCMMITYKYYMQITLQTLEESFTHDKK